MTKTRAKQLQLKALKDLAARYELLYNGQLSKTKYLEEELNKAKSALDIRNRSQLVNERAEFMKSLGQLTEALSKAIVYTVGKEQL